MDDKINSSGRFLFNRQQTNSRLTDILTAKDILTRRLNGLRDPASDISDIETTHKTFINSSYVPGINIAYEYYKSNANSGILSFGNGNEIIFRIPQNNQQFIGDMVINMRLSGFGDPNGATKYRYCDYPGVRLFKKATFEYDKAEIDSYTADDVMFERRFHLDVNLRHSWDRCMGQESPIDATIYYEDQQVRERRTILDGPQTPKSYQPPLDLWIKIHFDFNRSISEAFFISPMTVGKRELRFELEDISKIFFVQNGDSIRPAVNGPSILHAHLYTQNIYISDQIANLYAQTAKFRIVHAYTSISRTITESESSYKLQQMRYPTETIRIGFRPIENSAHPEHWHKYTKITPINIPIPVSINGGTLMPPLLVRRNIVATREEDVVTHINLGIKSDQQIYPNLPTIFFNMHLQTRNNLLFPPDDRGSMALSFNVARSEGNNVNGFIDLSIGDPLILEWVAPSENISQANPVELVISNKILKIMLLSIGKQTVFAQAESLTSTSRLN